MLASNLLGRQPADQQVCTRQHTVFPGINQHSPLDRLTPAPWEKKRVINKELKRNMYQRGWGAVSALEKRGGQEADICTNFQ
jgi:hypothetical protein